MTIEIGSMTGVSVQSAFFSSNVTFTFFPSPQDRVALVYGKNGSGKSTIAQGIREYCNSTTPPTVNLLPLTGTNSTISIAGSQIGKFFVFDETYVKKSISIKEDGLDAIVLFGAQVDLQKQIEELSAEITVLETQKGLQVTECEKFNNKKDVTSPLYWEDAIIQILKKTDGWADITGITINGGRRAANVTWAEIMRIGNLAPSRDETVTRSDFNRLLDVFRSTSNQSQTLSCAITTISPASDLEATATTLLATSVKKPNLTGREEYLLNIFKRSDICDAKILLSDQTKTICPHCLQTIEEGYRTQILAQIENILNREVEDFCDKVRSHFVPEIGDIYQQYSGLDPALNANVKDCFFALNIAIKAHNGQLQKKIDNPFDVLTYDASIKLPAAYDAFNTALTRLEAARIDFNDAISNRRTIQQTLIALNNDIAHYAIKNNFSSLLKQIDAKKQADDKLSSIHTTLAQKESEKSELDSQRQNFQIAVDEINHSLAYIFFSKGRLELELGRDHVYHLKSYGKPVEPQKVSCGERNALALCYFFTEIAKNMDIKAIYSGEVFLVIDDPVSSFDRENRIGIFSFLRWRLFQVLNGCPTTKVLLLTHDVSVMFDMEKGLREIAAYCKSNSRDAKVSLFQLKNKNLSDFGFTKYHEYTHLMEAVFEYAKGSSPENEFFIGNAMRRVLEAFATFVYKKGIDKISTDEAILSQIDDVEKRDYFRNLMYRLVLHNESHYEEQVRGLHNMDFFSHLSETEKQHTAKSILCFLYLLNDSHILAHLPNAKTEIEAWLEAIGSPSVAT